MKTEIKWAFLFIGMGLIWMIGEKLVGLHDVYIEHHAIFTNLVAIPAIAFYVFALLEKRKQLGGYMSYKQSVISGLIITGFVTLLTPLSQYITTTVITPEYFKYVIEYSVSNEMMSLEQAEAYFNLKNYVIQSTIFAPIMGLLTTLLVSIFTKKAR